MPSFNGLPYVPRQGKCQEIIRDRILELGYEDTINSMIPSSMGNPITKTKLQALYFSYIDLPLLVEVLQFDSILDIYSKAGIPVEIPDDFHVIEDLCSHYENEKLEKIISMLKKGAFGDVWWNSLKSPTDKLRMMFRRFIAKQSRWTALDFGEATEEIRRAYSHPYNAPSMDVLPELAQQFDVSLRWLLGIGPDGHLFSKRTIVEDLYDYYKLLSAPNRTIVIKMMQGGNP